MGDNFRDKERQDKMDAEAKQKEPVRQAIAESKPFSDSGKRTDLVDAPIISMNPVSVEKAEETNKTSHPKKDEKHLKVSKANKIAPGEDPNKKYSETGYPFDDLEVDEGVFVPTEVGKTTDKLVESMHKAIYRQRYLHSEVERDEDGDEILEMLCVKTRKRNEDGTIQLHPDLSPIEGANFVQRPKLVSARNYMLRAVTKDWDLGDGKKAPSDGVFIIRTV